MAFVPFGRGLFSGEGKVLGTLAILYRYVRGPVQRICSCRGASHIAGIAIERDMMKQSIRHERDR